MNTQQEMVEQNLRMLIGDLQIQLIFAKAQVQTLEQKTQALEQQIPQDVPTKANGAYPSEALPTG